MITLLKLLVLHVCIYRLLDYIVNSLVVTGNWERISDM